MNVASLELCKELYELSGWHLDDDGMFYDYPHYTDKRNDFICPKYDLVYLLRKLPNYTLQYNGNSTNSCTCHYLANGSGKSVSGSGDTPEEATCKLAIELFKQGILHEN